MREPPARVRFVGHPLVSLPIMGVCGFCLYAWSQNPGAIVVGVGAAICLAWTVRARTVMSQYRAWHRAWNSMAEPRAPRSLMPRLVTALIAVAVIGGFAAAESGVGSDTGPALAGLAVIGGFTAAVAVAIWALAKRLRSGRASRARTDRRDCVTVMVTRPILPVPELKDAYSALPRHCWQAINAGRQ